MAKIKQALDDFVPDARLVDERGPTQERMAKVGLNYIRADNGVRHLRNSTIEIAMNKKQISRRQYDAAQKFYNHWFRSGLMGSIGSIDLDMVFSGFNPRDGLAKTEQQVFHRNSYFKAISWLGRKSWILQQVVLAGFSFEDIGYRMGWNNRPQAFAAAMTETRSLLDRLCDEWGILE